MPIVSLVGVKSNRSVPITKMGKDESGEILKHLRNIGIAPGRQIAIIQKNGDNYIVRVDNDNPIALGAEAAQKIMVVTKDGDTFESSTKKP